MTSGELQALIDRGLGGVTSNPTIFDKAIAGSTDYDGDLHRMTDEGRSVSDIFEALALDDIGSAADLLRPVYDHLDGADGFVSLEVSPKLAYDTKGTIAEARRLFKALGRPNVMIKVPATPAGVPAFEALIGEGINVNVTLMFSLAQYEVIAEAYISGLERHAESGGDVSRIASVASFFVSRVDSAVDKALEEIGEKGLQGKIAVANAKAAYGRFREILGSERWRRLSDKGARPQRVLWASTGTKNPAYSDTLYVDSLIGPDTVNTLPPATLTAFLDHGRVLPTVDACLDDARAQLRRLSELGVSLDGITKKLTDDGVASFAESFDSLMASIAEKRDRLLAGWKHHTFALGSMQEQVDNAVAEMDESEIDARIWSHDHTVWKPEPKEITNRLGWLTIAEAMSENVDRLNSLTDTVRTGGYADVLLLGMGGSSLAPGVFRKTFGVKRGYLDLAVLDSTDPGAVLAHTERLDAARTLFIVATKSGTTAETVSFFKFFYNWVSEALGGEDAGNNFIAITDPGTKLVEMADRYKFRATFLNDPEIGGRYSALSYFGLVPASLVGVDVPRLLSRALRMICGSEPCVPAGDNPSVLLGAALGELAKAGRDKLTLVPSQGIAGFGDWVEQLIAESTGKEGRGIVPVVGEPLGSPDVYGDDRVFVHLRLDGDESYDSAMRALEEAGHPVVCLRLHEPYDMGGQFFLWEMATAVAGHRLGINPFDQPNVEAAKVLARQMVAEYMEKGALPEEKPIQSGEGIQVYGDVEAHSPGEVLGDFLKAPRAGAYAAIHAYLTPTAETDAALQALRVKLRDRLRLATTVGYGPRFLHSTGQLHKGDAGKGLFIQFTCDDATDVPIPDEAGSDASAITFGVLKAAQAMGDRKALMEAGRRVVRFHLGSDVLGGLDYLTEAF
jgi:transaldolase/glucose-6-phosphate isomerase